MNRYLCLVLSALFLQGCSETMPKCSSAAAIKPLPKMIDGSGVYGHWLSSSGEQGAEALDQLGVKGWYLEPEWEVADITELSRTENRRKCAANAYAKLPGGSQVYFPITYEVYFVEDKNSYSASLTSADPKRWGFQKK